MVSPSSSASLAFCSLLHARLGIPLHVGQLLALSLRLRRICGKRRSRDDKEQPHNDPNAENFGHYGFPPRARVCVLPKANDPALRLLQPDVCQLTVL